jgi:hypothetical protein
MGHASVDSGTLAVIDPCYVIGKGEEIYGWDNWDNLFEPYCNDLGVRFSSGYGDGTYQVWGYIVQEPGEDWKRVAQVTVCLISDWDED